MSDVATAQPPGLGQKLVAEFLGTFVLVFFGVGSVVIIDTAGGGGLAVPDITAIGLTFGIAVMVMVFAVGRVSGGHFNPAVSIGAAIGGRVPWSEALVYMAVQVLGGVVGAGAVAEGYPGFVMRGRMGANSFGTAGSGISWWAALVLEAILTAVFVLVILAVTDVRNEPPALAPLAIGFTLAAIHFVAIPATGTSVNPARSIGPALFSGTTALQQLWLFILAPLLGGLVAGVVYPAVFGHGTQPVRGSGLRFAARQPVGVPGYGAPDALQQQWQQPWASGASGAEAWQRSPQGAPPAPAPPAQPPYAGPAGPGYTPPPVQPQQQAPASWSPQTPGRTQPGIDDPDDGRTQIRPQR